MSAELLRSARQWVADDPDPATAAELSALIERASTGEPAALVALADAFDGTLHFGTAGLRGRLGPGSNRMNRVVVARAAAGFAAYLRERGAKSIVIGYDARRNSEVFARDTAEIMAGAGIAAKILPRAMPTPVTAFAIHFLRADAAVMVTASHNPPDDNGYKVYLGDGSQIVAPADADIAACIATVGAARAIARSGAYEVLGDALIDAYIARCVDLLAPGPRELTTVYTALHGVGGDTFMRAAKGAGFPEPLPVAAQFEPDGRFPTVRFPNPEEPGAMDLVLAHARTHDADIIIANDPDADRLSVGIPVAGGHRMLTGDEVGALLGWWVVERLRRNGERVTGLLAQSIVSGTLLREIAEDAGLGYAATLTGFKWISRVPGLLYGYEEALGYCVDPGHVTDKDGISAALLVMELAALLKTQGRGIQDALDDLAQRFGLHLTSQISLRVSDVSLIRDAMRRLREKPPTALGGSTVVDMVDMAQGCDGLPPTDGLRFTMDGARVIVRPSGTEPKLKCYLQIVMPVEGDLPTARARAEAGMAALRESVAQALALG